MKTALCLSGQPRFLETGFPFLEKNVIIPNNCDVFIHSWFNPNTIGQNYDGAFWNSGRTDSVKENIDKKILELYNPKKHIIEPQVDFSESCLITNRHGDASPFITYSMFYSIKTSNQLKCEYEKENKFVYDCVIRTRFDAGVLSEIKIENYDLTKINHIEINGFNDWFLFSSSKNMDIVTSTFNHLYEFWKTDNIQLIPEAHFIHNIQKNNLELNSIRKSLFLIRDKEFHDKTYFGKFWNE